MTSFGLNPLDDEAGDEQASLNPYDPLRDSGPSWYEGAGTGTALGLATSATELGMLAADAATPIVQSVTVPVDQQFGTDLTQGYDNWKDSMPDVLRALQPDPQVTGFLGEAMFGISSVLPQAVIGSVGGPVGSAALVGGTKGYAALRKNDAEGIDQETNLELSAVEATTQGLGVLLPGGMGKSLLTRAASGVGINVGFGGVSRGTTGKILEDNGYRDMAQQYRVMDGAAIVADAVLGAGFGALHGPNTSHGALDQSKIDIGLAANNLHNLEIDSAPGIPVDMATRNYHTAAMARATDQLMRGEPVDLSGLAREMEFLPKQPDEDGNFAEDIAWAMNEYGYGDMLPNISAIADGLPEDHPLQDTLAGFVPDRVGTVYDTARTLLNQLSEGPAFDISTDAGVHKLLGYRPQTLSSYLVSIGGITDPGGDLRSMDVHNRTRPGLVRKKGLSLDLAMRQAIDAGYFPGKTEADMDLSDFMGAIAEDVGKKRVYRGDDKAKIDQAVQSAQDSDIYAAAGITPETKIDDVVNALMEQSPDVFGIEDMTPEDVAQTLENYRRSTQIRVTEAADGTSNPEAFTNIYNDVYEQLVASNRERVTPDVARKSAIITAGRYVSRAERMGVDAYDLYREQNISALGEGFNPPADENALFQSGDKPKGLRSALTDAAANLKQDKGTGDQMLGILKNTAGVKEDELAWTGLDDFLRGKKSVTKAEITDYLAENQVQIEDVTLKGTVPADEAIQAIADDQGIAPDEVRENYGYNNDNDYVTLAHGMNLLGGQAKFSQYVLPGGENYREVLLTLPERTTLPSDFSVNKASDGWYVEKKGQEGQEAFGWGASKEAAIKDYFAQHAPKQQSFTSSHFDQQNILAHMRLNDRVDADGKKVLFVEEIQSDWHQAGRKKGYRGTPVDPDTSAWKIETHQDGAETVRSVVDDRGMVMQKTYDPDVSNAELMRDAVAAHRNTQQRAIDNSNAVPDAPFKKTWHEMAFRRVAQMAAQDGYDRVAWTTGAQQADRFDLSKSLLWVTYNENDAQLHYMERGGRTKLLDVAPDKLDEFVGKDLAQKLLAADKTPAGTARLEGDGLKIGGDGMKGFYDNILVKYADKFGKKFDAKVGETTFKGDSRKISGLNDDELVAALSTDDPANGQTFKAHSIDITPDMRRTAGETGFDLFQSGRDGSKRALISIGENDAIVHLFETADESSFMHEMAHKWLDEDMRWSERADAPEQFKADMAIIREFLGVKENAEIGREQHEKWASAFENYLAEGKAPSAALQNAFDHFKNWLVQIYKGLLANDVQITDPVRGVMDRMLATDAEIARKKASDAKEAPAVAKNATAQVKPGAARGDAETQQQDESFNQATKIADERPDMLVKDDEGNTVTAAEMIEQGARAVDEADEGGKMIEAAVDCFLRQGGAP